MLSPFKIFLTTLLILSTLSCSDDDTLISDPIEKEDPSTENTDDDEETTDDESENTDDDTTGQEEEEETDAPTVSNSVVNTYGQLSISGNKIVDKNGNDIQLRGMSLFWSQWSEGSLFYNAKTVEWLKNDWHANIVRAAMGVEEGGTGYFYDPTTEKEKVFAVIDAAIAEGIYVIVDWHTHHAENYLNESKAFFTEVAQKYGDYPNVIYEIYNEPLDVSWTQVLKPYHEAVISEIRKYDSDNIVVCGTRNWSQAVSEVIGNEINDSNVAYTLHYYSSTHLKDGDVWQEAQTAINAGIPLFVTEFGVTEASGSDSINSSQAENWWALLDSNKISWCNWSITNKDEASAALQPGTTINSLSVNNLTTSGNMVYKEMISKNEEF